MNKSTFVLRACSIALMALLMAIAPSFAKAQTDLATDVGRELAALIEHSNPGVIDVKEDEIRVVLDPTVEASGRSPAAIAADFFSQLQSQARMADMRPRAEASPLAVRDYTFSAWQPVNIGVMTINQRFKADVVSNKVRSLRFVGPSYGVGVGIAVWNHITSSWNMHSTARVRIKVSGTASAFVKGGSIALPLDAIRYYRVKSDRLELEKVFG